MDSMDLRSFSNSFRTPNIVSGFGFQTPTDGTNELLRLSHPLFSGSQLSGGSFLGLRAPRNPKKSVFDSRAHFCHSAPVETQAFGFTLRANAPEGQKRFPIIWGRCRNLS